MTEVRDRHWKGLRYFKGEVQSCVGADIAVILSRTMHPDRYPVQMLFLLTAVVLAMLAGRVIFDRHNRAYVDCSPFLCELEALPDVTVDANSSHLLSVSHPANKNRPISQKAARLALTQIPPSSKETLVVLGELATVFGKNLDSDEIRTSLKSVSGKNDNRIVTEGFGVVSEAGWLAGAK
jgi:hypothetical protein